MWKRLWKSVAAASIASFDSAVLQRNNTDSMFNRIGGYQYHVSKLTLEVAPTALCDQYD